MKDKMLTREGENASLSEAQGFPPDEDSKWPTRTGERQSLHLSVYNTRAKNAAYLTKAFFLSAIRARGYQKRNTLTTCKYERDHNRTVEGIAHVS